MQTFSFTKMQGAGNDYIYVNCFKEKIENAGDTARIVSDRHFGIGSDGLVLICPSDKADIRMDMYNSDGTRAEMCGNASRCVGRYAYDRGLTDKTDITLETLAGIKQLKLELDDEGRVSAVRVNMGTPEFLAQKIPVISSSERFIGQPITVFGKEYSVTCVSMGNPHAVIFVDDVDNVDIEKIGPAFETHELFPKRINTEFAQIIDRSTIKMRVWERGAGETLACGTGACAVMAAARMLGLTDDDVTLHLLGGKLRIAWDKNNIFMTGPAEFVFDGTITI